MTSNNNGTPPSQQWRWDRFDAKLVTSLAWANRSCVRKDYTNLLSIHHAMQRRVLQDKKAASHLIVGKLHKLLHDVADIAEMTYRCKRMQHTLPCTNSKDI
jgi:hypothetical protein